MSSPSLFEIVVRWAGACAVLAVGLTASVTLADARTVQLKGGGFVSGEVMEATPGQSVRVQMADGTVREIPWTDIERIDAPPPQPVPAPVPAPQAYQVQPAYAAPQLPPPSPYAAEIAALEEERRQIGIGGPITMLAVGAGAAGVLAYMGFVSVLLDSVGCDVGSSDCGSDDTFTTVLFVGAGIGAAIAIWGGIELGDRLGQRSAIRARIKELKAGRPVTSLRFQPQRNGGSLALTVQF